METGKTCAATIVAREDIKTKDVTGLLAGTTVMTLDGELPVEHLSAGDRIITRDTGVAVLRGITASEVNIAPVAIRAGSLGHTRPDRDTRLAPASQVHIRDWRAEAIFGTPTANIPASRLVDGEYISHQPVETVRIFALEFDAPHILYADGLEVVSA